MASSVPVADPLKSFTVGGLTKPSLPDPSTSSMLVSVYPAALLPVVNGWVQSLELPIVQALHILVPMLLTSTAACAVPPVLNRGDASDAARSSNAATRSKRPPLEDTGRGFREKSPGGLSRPTSPRTQVDPYKDTRHRQQQEQRRP